MRLTKITTVLNTTEKLNDKAIRHRDLLIKIGAVPEKFRTAHAKYRFRWQDDNVDLVLTEGEDVHVVNDLLETLIREKAIGCLYN